MSLLNRDFSGFFPFWTVPYSQLPSGWGYEMPLAALTKCYWLAKSATLTAALTYAYTNYSSDRNPNDILNTWVGAITGSGVVSDLPSGSLLMPVPPGSRTAASWLYLPLGGGIVAFGYRDFISIFIPPPAYLIDSGVFTSVDSGALPHPTTHTSPYSGVLSAFALNWFSGAGGLSVMQGAVAQDFAARKWYTDLQCSIRGVFGFLIIMGTNGYQTPSTPTATFLLKVSGVTIATIPIYSSIAAPPAFGSDSLVIGGTMTLDTDTFWTP